jgi:hypothetical protein
VCENGGGRKGATPHFKARNLVFDIGFSWPGGLYCSAFFIDFQVVVKCLKNILKILSKIFGGE